jgi:hypothetical protein
VAAAQKSWDDRAAEGMVIINKSIIEDPQLLTAVANLNSQNPHVVMNKLRSIFVSTSAIAVTTILSEYDALTNKSNKGPREYINDVRTKATQVTASGHAIPDRQIMVKIANTIAPTHDGLRAMLMVLVDSATVLDDFCETVIQTVGMIMSQQSVAQTRSHRETLMMTGDSIHGRGNRYQRRNVHGKAYRAQKTARFDRSYRATYGNAAADHYIRRPPQRAQGVQNQSQASSPPIVCYQCGVAGHKRNMCPARRVSSGSRLSRT